jgi:hypothetical protein
LIYLWCHSVGGKVKRADPVVTARALERLAAYRESVSENQLKKGAINPIYLAIEVLLSLFFWRTRHPDRKQLTRIYYYYYYDHLLFC